MPSTSDSYIYKSLKGATSFRLVKLTGRTSEGLIDCKLKQFELKAAPRYRALSYYWGSSSLTRAICIGGRVRPLHDNLWQFLDQMVTDGHLGYYWTDALCIDQANVHERNHQIGYMGDIYSLASEVIIWLGRAESTTSGMWLLADSYRYGKDKMKVPYGFNKQKRFVEVVQKSKVFNTMLHHTPCSIRELDCGIVVQHHRRAKVIKYKLAQAVLDLLNLPYWNRLWILQEVMLARTATVSCGASSVPFDYLVKLVNYCELEEVATRESRSILVPGANFDVESKTTADRRCASIPWLATTMGTSGQIL
ncbi:hypothetical protein PV11_08811 [Exophiala sideris]|uniref:Heterokaryon incompatibility domain-containing protein n=1 Tax=Exophiala sideris TaxID=1016849 RepID=A0A0D1Y246_9EURO|nr:hypothetical protein PV11_08811 [Exophiala sideris]